MKREGLIVILKSGIKYEFTSDNDAINFMKCMEQEGSIIICLKRHNGKLFKPTPTIKREPKM